MRRAAATLTLFSTELLAHPGHGAPEGHFHGLGLEHALLLAVILALLAFALGKK